VDFRETECLGVDCIQLTKDRMKWRRFVTKVMNFELHKSEEFLGPAEQISASLEGPCIM
jgi:hypothetical protein